MKVGLTRSWLIYRAQPFRKRSLIRFYSQFVTAGDLCFDLGAHLGNHTRAFVGLEARVIAVEPQPHFMRVLRHWYGKHPDVRLIEKAVGANPGQAWLDVSRLTPTVSTLSAQWRETVEGSEGFERVRWQDRLAVEVTTLDELIAEFGAPAFCKIDVEGGELEVMKGLSRPLPVLSFEYIPATVDIAQACVRRLAELGRYEYGLSTGEPPRLRGAAWVGSGAMLERLSALRDSRHSGDVIARWKDLVA
jgi:FkbM family methyltransferase